MSPLLSAALAELRGGAAARPRPPRRALHRGVVAVLVSLLVNLVLLWSLVALQQHGVGKSKRPVRRVTTATRIERPKLRKRTDTQRRRSSRPRAPRSDLPALALPSAVPIPDYDLGAGSSSAPALLHDDKAQSSALLESTQPLDEGLADTPPKALFPVSPVYPSLAQARGMEGSVTLRLLVGADGRVERVVVLRATPQGVFERAAIAAARQLRFTPARLGGRTVRVWVRKTQRFELR